MPRQASGSIESYEWKDGRTVTWRLRVRAYGARHRIDLGTNHEGWNEDRARVELERIRGQIERGTWLPPDDRQEVTVEGDETVQLTASRWWQRQEHRDDLRPKTIESYRWALDYILADLGRERTSCLGVQRIDDFRDRLVAKGLSPRSVNQVIDTLQAVLEDAVEYKLLDSNPAAGKRRRVRTTQPRRDFLEPDQVVDLLDVAGEWEAELPEHQRLGRRALVATLTIGGLRISEAIEANRDDVDVHGGRIRVVDAKTPAGRRDVEASAFLLSELRSHLAALAVRFPVEDYPDLPLFPTRTGGRLSPSNVRRMLNGSPARGNRQRVVGIVERANDRRRGRGRLLLPRRVTPHTLRRTFASTALAAGRDPRWVMAQLGHTDARFTLNVYAQVIQRQRLDHDLIEQLMGFGPTIGPTDARSPSAADAISRGA